jgi:hypothetical protein
MWIGRSLRIPVAILGIAGMLPAQSTPPAKPAEPRFSITISVDPEVVEAGSEVWVKAILTNKAKATTFTDLTDKAKDKIVLYVSSQYLAELDFTIYMYDAEGNLALLKDYGHAVVKHEGEPIAGSVVPLILRPQDSFKREIELSKLYDLTKPGKYAIQVERVDGLTGGVSRSNPVALTIKPKQ